MHPNDAFCHSTYI